MYQLQGIQLLVTGAVLATERKTIPVTERKTVRVNPNTAFSFGAKRLLQSNEAISSERRNHTHVAVHVTSQRSITRWQDGKLVGP